MKATGISVYRIIIPVLVAAVIVAASIGSLKQATTGAVSGTPVAPTAGDLAVIVGAALSVAADVLNRQLLAPAMACPVVSLTPVVMVAR